jgi:CBS domain-containing protein
MSAIEPAVDGSSDREPVRRAKRRSSHYAIQDVMARDPVIVHGEDDAEPLLAIFEGHDFNAVAVVDAEGYLLGMVTKLSLLRLSRGGSATGTTETETRQVCGSAT